MCTKTIYMFFHAHHIIIDNGSDGDFEEPYNKPSKELLSLYDPSSSSTGACLLIMDDVSFLPATLFMPCLRSFSKM